MRYDVKWRVNGKMRQKTFADKRTAEAFDHRVKLEKFAGYVPDPDRGALSLDGFAAQEYWPKYGKLELSASTRTSYATVYNAYVSPALGDRPLRLIGASDVAQMKVALIGAGVGGETVRKALTVLSSILARAAEWGHVGGNVARLVKVPAPGQSREAVAMVPATVEIIRAAMPTHRDKALVSLLGYAGLRPGEALALESADIARKTIRVSKALALGEVKSTKTGNVRIVPAPSVLAEELHALGPGLLFPRADGERWTEADYRNWRVRRWQPAATVAGVGKLTVRKKGGHTPDGRPKTTRRYEGARPYDLRHSCASLLLRSGLEPLRVARAMGHSLRVLDKHYAHLLAELDDVEIIDPDKLIRSARTAAEGADVVSLDNRRAA